MSTPEWTHQCKMGIIDALVDLGRDLDLWQQMYSAADFPAEMAINRCVSYRIGTGYEDKDESPLEYNNYFEKYIRGVHWAEGRLCGYTETLRMLSHIGCDNDGIQALRYIGNYMSDLYGEDNTGDMEVLVDAIHNHIGTPNAESDSYTEGYKRMLRIISCLANLKGV